MKTFFFFCGLFCAVGSLPAAQAENSSATKVAILTTDLERLNTAMIEIEAVMKKNHDTAFFKNLQLLAEAFAADGQAGCLDNGIITFQDSCDKSNWSQVNFDADTVTQLQTLEIGTACGAEKNCGLTMGYQIVDGKKHLFCANSSTKTCLARSQQGDGLKNLATDVYSCSRTPANKTAYCMNLTKLLKEQTDKLAQYCATHPKGLKSACRAVTQSIDGLQSFADQRLDAKPFDMNSLSKVAYIGDSEIALGGIGKGLGCLNNKNIIAFGNAKASTYVGGEPCKLFGSYHPETDSGNLCDLAKVRFNDMVAKDKNEIDTIVVGLGDNVNTKETFRTMLQKIRNSGKNCLWVMPAKKVGDNSNGNLAKKTLTDIAKEVCGAGAYINPSADGTSYKTISSDHVHYKPSEGKKIGQKICSALSNMAHPPVSESPPVQ